ncbi:50S ribosomal protein L3 N(5)-glutamine methyltransferase [Legionella pneumophila]|uniref:Ribosomal protein uL3 glutamine methyltransferase n=1 Tax=Legionella pneumophila TaxID=446 RepID=A0AAP3HFM4_LEGPN|nr:50S ribosomal protein L3 N(5)-glutamine methyltransferase [Legionella pneumophila]MCZ4692488.1 50S ribosomal protein L3 N(5)-glutamine methyltransferase [Legionella pneumophila]MCZ4710795.1 50S ribosomal protein L3 N(5)-glutamine methyltransferase [Legionella pneumophila]MCZ4720489.1 50S ribosomal protein L3 N(5)-glutamine methyltransferase [Legionella pneumophila]WBA06605.1 adenine specific methylase [Legionella pneumophila]HAT3869571.1 50S ribosomal protein L3 N(5)-glutamine methyltransfe
MVMVDTLVSSYFSKETEELVTILDFLRFSLSCAENAQLFYGHGTDNAWDDMRSLILRSLSLPYDVDPFLLNARLTTSERKHLCNQLDKRINQRVPVPYLIKEAYFCDLPFYVDERVLIPRSPIGELINNQFSPWIEAERVHHVLDLCTGSGCIAIACCYAFPEAQVDAVDISNQALAVATINCERYDVGDQLALIESDCFTALSGKQYDLIVSNPPYVGKEEMQTLPDEYRHEPVLALETGNNGLAIIEKILKNAHAYLSEHGILVVEVGNSEQALCETYPMVPFTWLEMSNGGQGVFLLTKQQLEDYFK